MTTALLSDLESAVLARVRESPCSSILLHAGHFALDGAGEIAQDRLSAEVNRTRGTSDFVMFARRTWELGCRVAKAATRWGKVVQLAVLVNDWQFLQPAGRRRRALEKMKAKMRADYYRAVPTLPEFHQATLREHGLSPDIVVRDQGDRWMFSENALRERFVRSIRRVFREGRAEELGLEQSFTSSGDPVIRVHSVMDTEVCLIYCGSTNCAGEIAELLRRIYERDVRHFINLYPAACDRPVEAGTKVAQTLHPLRGLTIDNFALSLTPSEGSPQVEWTAHVHEPAA